MAGSCQCYNELRKHEVNDGKCRELGWVCVLMVVEAYGAWGAESMESATSSNQAMAAALNSLYGRLNINLVYTANATAMLSHSLTSVYASCRAPFKQCAQTCMSGPTVVGM